MQIVHHRPRLNIDIAIMVSMERFEEILRQRFGVPNPGSAKERTMRHARAMGKIQAGEAGLRPLCAALEAEFGIEVDISIRSIGGQFDSPTPWS